jgi:hypothetical protein
MMKELMLIKNVIYMNNVNLKFVLKEYVFLEIYNLVRFAKIMKNVILVFVVLNLIFVN